MSNSFFRLRRGLSWTVLAPLLLLLFALPAQAQVPSICEGVTVKLADLVASDQKREPRVVVEVSGGLTLQRNSRTSIVKLAGGLFAQSAADRSKKVQPIVAIQSGEKIVACGYARKGEHYDLKKLIGTSVKLAGPHLKLQLLSEVRKKDEPIHSAWLASEKRRLSGEKDRNKELQDAISELTVKNNVALAGQYVWARKEALDIVERLKALTPGSPDEDVTRLRGRIRRLVASPDLNGTDYPDGAQVWTGLDAVRAFLGGAAVTQVLDSKDPSTIGNAEWLANSKLLADLASQVAAHEAVQTKVRSTLAWNPSKVEQCGKFKVCAASLGKLQAAKAAFEKYEKALEAGPSLSLTLAQEEYVKEFRAFDGTKAALQKREEPLDDALQFLGDSKLKVFWQAQYVLPVDFGNNVVLVDLKQSDPSERYAKASQETTILISGVPFHTTLSLDRSEVAKKRDADNLLPLVAIVVKQLVPIFEYQSLGPKMSPPPPRQLDLKELRPVYPGVILFTVAGPTKKEDAVITICEGSECSVKDKKGKPKTKVNLTSTPLGWQGLTVFLEGSVNAGQRAAISAATYEKVEAPEGGQQLYELNYHGHSADFGVVALVAGRFKFGPKWPLMALGLGPTITPVPKSSRFQLNARIAVSPMKGFYLTGGGGLRWVEQPEFAEIGELRSVPIDAAAPTYTDTRTRPHWVTSFGLAIDLGTLSSGAVDLLKAGGAK